MLGLPDALMVPYEHHIASGRASTAAVVAA